MRWDELLERERLRNLPPDQVYEALSALKEPEFDDNLPEATIAVLLERNEPLVDLAIARFCSNRDAIGKLFAEGGALRVAVLANRNAWPIWRWRLLEEDALAEVLRAGSDEEAQAFLSNPSVPSDLLQAAAAGQGIGKDIPEERRMCLVLWLAENPALKTLQEEGDNFDDATSAWDQWRPIQALWNLLWHVPPTLAWARVLNTALGKIAFKLEIHDKFVPDLTTEEGREEWEEVYSTLYRKFDLAFIDMLAERWATPPEEEVKNFDYFAQLRETVAAKFVEAKDWDRDILAKLRDSDQAMRLGYYNSFEVRPSTDLEPFWQRDAKAFVEAMLYNKSLYKLVNWKVQQAFDQMVYQVDPHDEDLFRRRWRNFRKYWREKNPAIYGYQPTEEMRDEERQAEEAWEAAEQRQQALEQAQAKR